MKLCQKAPSNFPLISFGSSPRCFHRQVFKVTICGAIAQPEQIKVINTSYKFKVMPNLLDIPISCYVHILS